MTTNNKIVLATHNPGKVAEFQQLLTNYQIINQGDLNIASVPETGSTFVENALIKARHAAQASGCPAIADDSGLEVAALNGAPGIYSARYAGEACDDGENNKKLLAELEGITDRGANFRCVLVYLNSADDPSPIIAEGIWQGEILTAPRGTNGFGYDSLFYVPSEQCSAAELTAEVKNKLSHRGQALKKLISLLA